MKASILDDLQCSCGNREFTLSDAVTRVPDRELGAMPTPMGGCSVLAPAQDREARDIESGDIVCRCGRRWLIENGSPRFSLDRQEFGPHGMRVVEANPDDDPRLLPFLASCPDATVYHHPAWLRTLKAEYNRKVTMLACESRDGRLCGIFPLMYTRGLPIPAGGTSAKARLASLPRTPIAGLLGKNHEASRLLLRAAIDRVSQHSGLHLQIRTEGPVLDGLIEGVSGTPWRQSFVLPLPEDPTALTIGSSSTQRSRIRWSIKKARNLGLRVRVVSLSECLEEWYGLYLQNMRRVVIPPRPIRFFQAMSDHLEPLGLLKVIVAERHTGGKTELIAGSIFLMYGARNFYAFTACPAKHFPLRPQDLIQWEAIQWSVQHGFREYDLGEVTAGDTELASFKAKWGAQPRHLYRYYYPQVDAASADSSPVSSHQSAVLATLWRSAPLFVTAQLGNLIYRYF